MDAMSGRQQTTKGVWVARSPKVDRPPTLVLDLEGSDGRERGEDDTNFERQSALFALAVADALLVNVWCHDIGREHGSGKPLLKTIFGVNLKLFSPEPGKRRTTLLFVIRDRSKTPLKALCEVLRDDLDRLWLSLPKPVQARDKTVDDYFDVQYAALPHYEERHEEFCAEVDALRRRFSLGGGGGGGGESGAAVAGNGDLVPSSSSGGDGAEPRLPADAFAMSAAGIWDVIRAQKDLNLPAHKVMVAGVRCREIAADQLSAFESDQAWQALRREAMVQGAEVDGGAAAEEQQQDGATAAAASSSSALVPDFGARLQALAASCLAGYDAEAAYFDAGPRAERRDELRAKLAEVARPAFDAQVALAARKQASAFERALKVAAADARPFSEAAREARADALRGFDADGRRACVPAPSSADASSQGGGLLPTDLSPDAARTALASALDALVDRLKRQRLKDALHAAQRLAADGVAVPAVELLQSFPPLLWPRLHSSRDEALEAARKSLDEALKGVDLTEEEAAHADARLQASAEGKLRDLLREAALTRVARMRERFSASFSVDPDTRAPRSWRPRDDVPALAREARMAAARVLASLAVRRGADYVGGDSVERAVLAMAAADCSATAAGDREAAARALAAAAASGQEGGGAAAADMVGSIEMAALGSNGHVPGTPAASLQGAPGSALKPGGGGGGASAAAAATPSASTPLGGGVGGYDLATASAWPAGSVASPEDVLITPAEARTAWRELMASSALAVQQALTAQQASAAANRRGAPVWALIAILLLGWNELVAVLWNPLYLIIGVVVAAFGWQLYSELDVDAEMQRGLVPGLISIGGRLLPTARGVAERSLASVARLVAEGGQAMAEREEEGQEGDGGGRRAGGGSAGRERPAGRAGSGGAAAAMMAAAHPSAHGLAERRRQAAPATPEAEAMDVDADD
jgi:hypothetical protein